MINQCKCGCGAVIEDNRQYVSGHNLKNLEKTKEHRAKIREGQRIAWLTKRPRMPVGSTRISYDGYVLVKVHPGQGLWRAEHILAMEKHIGRKIEKGEQVHHINKRRDDNRIENLVLCSGMKHHMKIEASLVEVIAQLAEKGVIVFNRNTDCYETIL